VKYERRVLAELVRASGCDNYLEIGSLEGDSIRDVLEYSPDIQITSVDCKYADMFWDKYRNDPRIRTFEFTSDAAYRRLKKRNETFSNIYIDADHSYEWVKHDINKYWELWDHKGFFGGHDFTKHKRTGYGVVLAVTEFFGIPNHKAIHRIWYVKNGTIFISGTNWIYTEDIEKFQDVISTL